ncbi:hypothetical protein [Chondromyces crocatus]|uniref:Uncharacterized protein n=1 Tax=Chondromyces crocatus TaxID=52 RepID=A0A0K1E5V0_CHOCO|nr:hypothetical protein [Chondromyces crocatus]AKT35953.1 uncharacterized protein CMC5_000650 [Chondromyces crocatus]
MDRRWGVGGVAALALGIAVLLGKPWQTASAPPQPGASSSGDPRPAPSGGGSPARSAPHAVQGSSRATSPPSSAGPELVVTASWGAALGQLGRERPDEGNPEAPMSLAADGKGRLLVLDQINHRLVRYGVDGKPETSLPIDLRTAQDVTVAPDGSVAVLERIHEKAVVLFDEAGKPRGALPLLGEGIDEAGHVTGVFVDGDDVYAEREHGPLVKLGDTRGTPASPRTEIPGRPSRDGALYLNAGIIQADAGRAYVAAIDRARMANRFTRELRFDAVLGSIRLLDSDRAGVIYFAVQTRPSGSGDETLLLTCLDPANGQTLGGAVMPVNTLPEETFRDLAVLDEGGVLHALRTEAGTSYQRYDCP